ncbi:acyl-CoA dehydrogenase family protein [Smaragdicoccus niigatensis]|uniref:acyl-CoA dehydrogenase family protein n=1 Tax=Smaragdicoccus niigatensis TaxID=359359 RepID=UPI000371A0F8|nr:acyl-CoA dehydrogenase family protein [Smaragdicoccus niigatensis]
MALEVTDAIGRNADPLAESPEQLELRAMIRSVIEAAAPVDRTLELDDREEFDEVLHKRLAELGIMSIGAPESDGGMGDIREQATVVEELAAGPTSMAINMVVHYMGVEVFSSHGSPAHKAQWLGRLLSGDAKFSFALSEPGAGTDIARGMRTSARNVDGSWVINGQKTWISGATHADVFLVVARTAPIQRSAVEGVTMFVMPADTPGISVRELPTVAVHGLSTCEVFFDNVTVPESAVMGEVHQGFRMLFGTLNRERINAAAGSIGAARGALEYAVNYANERQAFGRSIGAFQAVQHRLVDGALAIESARGLVARAAAVEAAGGRADILSSMAKVAASEAAVKVTTDGMEILGGAGFSREIPMQRWFRDVRLWVFAPLANDMVRNNLGTTLLGLPKAF